MIVKTRIYQLYPNQTMKQVLDDWCDYRRYCWNQALALWQDLYMAHTILDKVVATVFIPKQDKKTKKWKAIHRDQHLNPSPNWRLVRDRMIEQKKRLAICLLCPYFTIGGSRFRQSMGKLL